MISICIPNYNRYEFVIDSISDVIGLKAVSEIIISDDCSDDGCYQKLLEYYRYEKKVKIHRNVSNVDCYLNKKRAIELSSKKWCIILDSDNKIGKDYIETLMAIKDWDKDTIYQPCFARPTFDFREYAGSTITKKNVALYMDLRMISTLLNAMNYFLNRNKYLEVFEYGINPHTADSILQNYNHLKSGGKIYVTPGLEYDHRVHDGSHYKTQNHLTGNLYNDIETKLRQLK